LNEQQSGAETISTQSHLALKQMVERILSTGRLSRQEHLQLVNAFLSGYKLTEEERYLINQVFDERQMERLKFVS
jgi:hypothetical protein